MYVVLTLGCHTSLGIDFSWRVQMEHTPPARTHGHIANYHNAPMLSVVIKKNVNMAIICGPTAF